MTTEAILKTIYNYYPQNISLDDVEAYDTSIEYRNRLKKCQEAKENNDNWMKLKRELNLYDFEEDKENVYDYSVLGSEPCYSATIDLGNSQEPLLISILISVIIPLWTYRIIDSTSICYKYKDKKEEKIIVLLQSLIEKYFLGYDFIKEDQHQMIIHDIDTVFQSNPTIFEAIFKSDLN